MANAREPNHRTTEQVLHDHLDLRLHGDLETDLERNYDPRVVLLTVNSNQSGHDAIRTSAKRLRAQLPDADFEIVRTQVNGPFALLIWAAHSPKMDAVEGADSFLIENGKIIFQSIHYGLTPVGKPFGEEVTVDGRLSISSRAPALR